MYSVWIGIMLPFIGTTLGAACVFFLHGSIKPIVQKALLGFASGIMVAASVWSLLIPAIEMSESMKRLAFVPAATGVALGMAFLLLMDRVIPHLHQGAKKPEGMPWKIKKNTMLFLAVTLHNVPEGMAVGVVFAGLLSGEEKITLAAAVALSVGIAIQNFPEGAIVSLPICSGDNRKGRAFLYGMLSGVVEPLAAFVTIIFSQHLIGVLPYLLAFAAGAMLYVVIEELVPEASEEGHSNVGTIMFGAGFIVMMILDVALG